MNAHPALLSMLRGQQAVARVCRTDRYVARVDEHMAGMADADKLAFLRKELATWERRYAVYQRAVERGDEIGTQASAYDYAQTIAAVATRIAMLERVPA